MQENKEAVKPVDELTFAMALAELEGIISALEGNTLELEESLEKYERGVSLLRSLEGRLASAELKIEALQGELIPQKDDEQTDTTLS